MYDEAGLQRETETLNGFSCKILTGICRFMLNETFNTFYNILQKSLASRRWATQAATYEDTLTVPETKVTTLKNLLRVASEETNAATATVSDRRKNSHNAIVLYVLKWLESSCWLYRLL